MTRRPWLTTDPAALFTTPVLLETGNCPRDGTGLILAGTVIGEISGQHVAFDETNPAHQFAGLLWDDIEGDGIVPARIYTGNGTIRGRVDANYLPVKTGAGAITSVRVKNWVNSTRFTLTN